MEVTTIILAAGKGTRMKSSLPKVLHKVCGKPMLEHVINAAKGAGSTREVVVIGSGADKVREEISGVEFALQSEQLGTGHAVMMTKDKMANLEGTVMILCGDTPLITSELLQKFIESHEQSKASATVLTAIMPDATGYGRIVRNQSGTVDKIVEHKDATEDELQIHEVNSGMYCFDIKTLFDALDKVTNDNAQGEYYLTDVLGIIRSQGFLINAFVTNGFTQILGINSRYQLATAERILRQRKNLELMDNGVTILDPDSTFIDYDVEIGRDSTILPFTYIENGTTIGENCSIGPNCRLQNTKIGNNVTMQFVYAHDAEVDDEVVIGPYVHLRPGTKINRKVKIGNFVEVKNSNIGEGSKLPHLQYIGDTDMGANVNLGCGTVTCNYDGKKKYRTTIGDNVFVGCNTNLVAPVTVNNGAYIAAGSTITQDVPENSLAVGRARQVNKTAWKDKRQMN
ncbi:MAG: bifunctional UDP-N-acetylglucosamine diphosphorylase/glucosamine-1-phosphate N-acetyltransferase GlmU [Selenomonadaceae bacterium]|nr:bifunctional UDP-N-acetylglucosamine diphosphorylase/glucosamine-1-phosphate N-acetyltransferase GlmU [Selenomonadaceae bacterium]